MSRKIRVDLTGVESFKRASEGEHVCKIATADLKQSQGGNDMIVVAYEVTKGEDKGARVYENYPLVDTALWKLKGLLEAIGMKADGKVQLDLDKLVGKVVTVLVKHEEYDGKIRARVDEVKKFSAAVVEEEEDDEVEEKPAMNPPVEEEDDEAEEESVEKKPIKKVEKKKTPKKPVKEEEPEDDWSEDEEEEEKPAKKAPAKAKSTEKKAPKKPAKKVEEDEDDDWDDDDWDE